MRTWRDIYKDNSLGAIEEIRSALRLTDEERLQQYGTESLRLLLDRLEGNVRKLAEKD